MGQKGMYKMKNDAIKFSVICAAYNQANFIRSALDGFVSQKTNFKFQVFVYDDASTDGTTDIIREYAEKYPDIIKPIIQTENQFSKGVDVAKTFIWPKIDTEYVAMCDGDDYWCDKNKLQKQVDFLDKHPDYTVCFHPVEIFWDDNSHPEQIWPKRAKDTSLNKLLHGNFIPNCAVMYRWQAKGLDLAKEWPTNIYPGDWFLHLLHARQGKIGFLPDVMARYRRHAGGISFVSECGLEELHKKYGLKELNFYLELEKKVAPDPKQYHKFVCSQARGILDAYSKHKDLESATQVLKLCPDLMMDYASKADVIRWHHNFNKLIVIIPIILLIGIIIGGVL